MKADMNRLMETKGKPDPYRHLAKKAAAFVCCLSMLGVGMVFHALQSRDSASADEMFDPSLSNPSFTVQQEADVTVPDIQAGDGPVAVLTMKGGGYSTTPDEEGLVQMKKQRIRLYEDYGTDWFHTDTLGQMSYVGTESAAYELKEVWIGKNPASVNQSDFLVAQVNGFNQVAFTNNPANPDLSQAEGGYYIPSEAGTYLACIEDGTVVRLVFGEKEGWSYAGAKVMDYDVTDGGYYKEDDYFHREDKHETSGAVDEDGAVYVDAIQSGINSADNYIGTGTKLAFGADLIGMDLAEESLTGELDNLNIFNYEQQGKTNGTGVTLGLMKGLTADGNPMWADNVSAPALFARSAKGKTVYDTEYSLTFTDIGTMHTLSSVESEWGTAAEGLEKVGADFWILDGAPSFGTDGHDITWGTGNENLQFYRSRDRAPEVLPSSADGLEHNRYFGISWTEDFTLEPGYTGPLNVFGISDDDLWVFAAQIGDDGKAFGAVQAIDLGGVHETAGGWCDLWDIIDKVPTSGRAQNWRLYFFALERDGDGSQLSVSYNIPEPAVKTARDTGTVMVEASKYESAEGIIRTFVLDNGGHDFYKLTYNDGREATVTDGEQFQIESGSFVSIDGMDTGDVFHVKETGRENVWHSIGEGFEEGDTAECTVGYAHRISFLSTLDSGTLTLTIAGDGDPEGGYRFLIHLEDMKDKEVSAMDGYNNPLGTRFTDKDGNIEVVLAAGETLKLYGLPDDTEFIVTPETVPGWRLAEILLDGADADGVLTKGTVPGYMIYRYEENGEQALQVTMEQSVSGDWDTEDISVNTGSLISYRINVTNPNAYVVEASVEDTLPEGLKVMESSVTEGSVDGQHIRWDIIVEGGSSVELSFTCLAEAEGPAEFTNTPILMDGLEPKYAGNTVKAVLP